METTVPIQSAREHFAVNFLTKPFYTRNLIKIDGLVLEIFNFESVDEVRRTIYKRQTPILSAHVSRWQNTFTNKTSRKHAYIILTP